MFRKFTTLVLLFIGASHHLGCSPAARSPGATTRYPTRTTITAVPRTVVSPSEALTVNELFERGMRRFSAKQYALAAQDLETAAAAAPDQPWAPNAYYQAAIARDESGRFSACAEDLRKVIGNSQVIPEKRDAHLRLIRILVYLERWKEAGEEADAMLSRYPKLRTLESIVVGGAKALANLSEGDVDRAEFNVEKTRTLIEQEQYQLPLKLHRDVAVVYFALGEIRRLRAEAIQFLPPPTDFSARLERRCQLLLDAQSAYSNSMRAYDAHWSLMAGYRVGALYAQLHADLMAMLPEVSFESAEHKKLFEAALRLRYSVLLSKAVDLMRHSLTLAERTDDNSSWVELTRHSVSDLEASLKREQEALRQVPYSREELSAALEQLKKNPKNKNAGGASSKMP